MAREYEGIAQALASRGRYGDSMLMHVNPEEVNLLENLAPGGITVNPDTGLPEAFVFSLAGILTALLGTTLGGSLAGGIMGVLGTLGSFLGIAGPTAAAVAPTVAAAAVPTGLVAAGAPALGVGAGMIPMGFGAGGASIVAPGVLGGGVLGGAGGGLTGGALGGATGALAGTAVGGMPVSLLGAGGAPSVGTLSGGALTGAAPAAVPGATLPGIAGGALPELSLGVPSLPSALPTASPFAAPGAAPGAVPGAVPGAAPAGPVTLPVEAPGMFETVIGELAPRALLGAGIAQALFPGDEDSEEEGGELSEEEIASREAFENFTPLGPPAASDIVGFPTDEAFETFVSDPSMMPGAGVEDIGTLALATMAPPPSGIGGEQIDALGGGELYMDYVNSGSPLTFEEWIQMEGVVA